MGKKSRITVAGLEHSPSHLLHRALQLALDIYAEETGAGAVTQRQYAVLAAAAEHEGLTQTDLVRATGIDRSTLADMISRMITKGLLERARSETDARANTVKLSDEGRAVLDSARPKVEAADERILAHLSHSKRDSFISLLRDLSKASDKAAASDGGEKADKAEKSRKKKDKEAKKAKKAKKAEKLAARAEPRAAQPNRLFGLQQIADFAEQGFGRARRRRRGGLGVSRGLAKGIGALDDQEDHEGDDQELDDRVQEGAVTQRDFSGLGGGIGRLEHEFQLGKIDVAQQQPDGRHDDLIDQRGDNLAERAADDHADSQIEHIAPGDKLFEFRYDRHATPLLRKRLG